MIRWIIVALVLTVSSGCASVRYQRPGHPIAPRAEETLVFTRLRFFHDGVEFFPWEPRMFAAGVGTVTDRHVWLLRLHGRAVSAELHPDADGSLAIWLAHGDYALIGSEELPTSGLPPYEVMALLRVPAGSVVAYAGELNMRTRDYEGGHLSRGELGESSVTWLPIDSATVALEQRFGALPETPVRSLWCAGEGLPEFDDVGLETLARERLDRGCVDGMAP